MKENKQVIPPPMDAAEKLAEIKKQRAKDKTVGSEEELVPFNWRFPLELEAEKKPTKVMRVLLDGEKK